MICKTDNNGDGTADGAYKVWDVWFRSLVLVESQEGREVFWDDWRRLEYSEAIALMDVQVRAIVEDCCQRSGVGYNASREPALGRIA